MTAIDIDCGHMTRERENYDFYQLYWLEILKTLFNCYHEVFLNLGNLTEMLITPVNIETETIKENYAISYIYIEHRVIKCQMS